ncbi:MAG: (2Fe-2S) ferredoxin domain-containing protein [Cyanobacteria bacterium P01_G01_bin.38]
MPDTKQLPPRMFTLEGTFLGYLGKSPNKVKSIVLEVEQEQILIKLPKELRATLREYQLQPGHRVRCIGRTQIDLKAGVIKLKAYQLFPLPPRSDDPPLTAPSAAPSAISVSKIVASPRVVGRPPTAARQKRAKVLVCRKSGCQKRGGRQLVAKLEQILQAHQLDGQVEIEYTGCQKRCSKAPTLTVMPGKHRYDRLSLKSLPTLVEKHFCASEQGSAPNSVDP